MTKSRPTVSSAPWRRTPRPTPSSPLKKCLFIPTFRHPKLSNFPSLSKHSKLSTFPSFPRLLKSIQSLSKLLKLSRLFKPFRPPSLSHISKLSSIPDLQSHPNFPSIPGIPSFLTSKVCLAFPASQTSQTSQIPKSSRLSKPIPTYIHLSILPSSTLPIFQSNPIQFFQPSNPIQSTLFIFIYLPMRNTPSI